MLILSKNRIHENFYTPLFGPKDGTEYFPNEKRLTLKRLTLKRPTLKRPIFKRPTLKRPTV